LGGQFCWERGIWQDLYFIISSVSSPEFYEADFYNCQKAQPHMHPEHPVLPNTIRKKSCLFRHNSPRWRAGAHAHFVLFSSFACADVYLGGLVHSPTLLSSLLTLKKPMSHFFCDSGGILPPHINLHCAPRNLQEDVFRQGTYSAACARLLRPFLLSCLSKLQFFLERVYVHNSS